MVASRFCAASFALIFSCVSLSEEKIGYHEVRTDASGRIVPWYGAGPSQAYDRMVRLVFDFWLKIWSPTTRVLRINSKSRTVRIRG